MLADIRSQTREQLETQFKEWGQPAYRVGQLLEWLYVRRVTDWDAMTNLPKALRERLRGQYALPSLALAHAAGFGRASSHRDLTGRDRFVLAFP